MDKRLSRVCALIGLTGTLIFTFQNCGGMNSLHGSSASSSNAPSTDTGASNFGAADGGAANANTPNGDVGMGTTIPVTPPPTPYVLANAWGVAPLTAAQPWRNYHSAVWTGTRALIWGGRYYASPATNQGISYDPSTGNAIPMSTVNAPAARIYHCAVWTGSKMIVFGGSLSAQNIVLTNTGGIYDPATDTWGPLLLNSGTPPPARALHECVWTGSKMLVFGHYAGVAVEGYSYDPATGAWTSLGLSVNRSRGWIAWTGSKVIYGGGIVNGIASNTVSEYDPATGVWADLPAPSAYRHGAIAVWTGREVVIWGGVSANGFFPSTPEAYDPVSKIWRTLSSVNAPAGFIWGAGVWTGSKMLIYGSQTPGNLTAVHFFY